MVLLRIGSSGAYVEMLQLALRRAGHYSGALDGLFGPQTRQAVVGFQRANGLSADGVAGANTWNALNPYLTGYVARQVVSGDTLFRLANAYGTTIRAIETANPGIDPTNLMTGSTLVVPLGFSVVPNNISYCHALLGYCVTGLKARYPFLTTGSAGSSVMGRSLYWLSIGTGSNSVFYNASHHANEWITTPLLMRFLEDYARAYSAGGNIGQYAASRLYGTSTVYVIPMVNPDGVDLVTGAVSSAFNSGYYYAARNISQDFPAIPFPDGWKANIRGTDPNLQYPAGWEKAREIKYAQGFTKPAPRDFVGTAPLSAPESRAVYNFTLARDFALTLSYHTQGETIYWKYSDFNPPNSYEIALQFAALSGYQVAVTPSESGNAGYKDWFIQNYNRPGYTIEAGLGENPLPIGQFDTIYRDNIGILTLAAIATV